MQILTRGFLLYHTLERLHCKIWEGYPIWQTKQQPAYNIGILLLGLIAFTWYNVIVSCKRDQIKMSGYVDRRVTPPERVTQLSPIPTSM